MIGNETALAGKTAIVTGGASGIGHATAEQLRALGARVVAVDKSYGDEPGSEQDGIETVSCDLSSVAAIDAAVSTVASRTGTVDILINCAGIVGPKSSIAETAEADWDLVQSVNLKATVFMSRAVIPLMTKDGRRGGRIVNVSSAAAHRTKAHSVAYASSKAGVESVTRLLAGELAPFDVAVNAVAPGVTATAIFGEDSDEARAKRASEGATANLFGRFAVPDDIAGTIVFLCLPESRQITGQILHVSAGAIV